MNARSNETDSTETEKPFGNPEDLADAEGGGTLAVLARAEINQQISTAKAYPRSITEFGREAVQLATLNEEMARACVYALPRGSKTIEGPSARFAEIMAYSFRNMRYGARPVMEEQEFITSQGVAYDLERNNGITIEVRRRITDSQGRRFNADMIGVTTNAANAIALRNAVLKIIPKALWNPIYQKARHVIMGDFETFNNRLGKMFEEFQRYGVTKEALCSKLGKKGVADITMDDLVVISGLLTAIQEGDTTPEQTFGRTEDAARNAVEQPKAKSQSAPPAADPAPQPSTHPENGNTAGRGAAADQNGGPSMKPSQVNIIKTKLKHAGLTDVDLEAAFGGKSLEPKAGKEQFGSSDFADVTAWIEKSAKV